MSKRRWILEKVENFLVHCPNFQAVIREETGTLGNICRKYGPIGSCQWCPTCPNCGGRMKYETHMRILNGTRHFAEAMVCTECSLHVEKEALLPAPIRRRRPKKEAKKDDDPNLPPRCAVEGCNSRTWEGRHHGQHRICISHYQKILGWRRRGLPQERFPLVELEDGTLRENPKYREKMVLAKGRGGTKK